MISIVNTHYGGYTQTKESGLRVVAYMEAQNLRLIHDAKQQGAFCDTNPTFVLLQRAKTGKR